MDPFPCRGCSAELGPSTRRKAFISVFAQGDEETRSWYFCEPCRVWMIEEYTDRFMGGDSVRVQGPFPETACIDDVALAKTCPDPGDKWCECPAHQQLGNM